MPQCKGRYVRFADRKPFADGKHYFFVPRRCREPATAGSEACGSCLRRLTEGVFQERRQFNHGLVDEPVPDWSHIYGGAWYEARTEAYGAPDEGIIVWAEEYARVALLEGDEHKAAERELGMDPVKKKRGRPAGETPAKEKAATGKAAGGAGKAPAKRTKAAGATPAKKPVTKPETKPPTYVATHLEKELDALTVDDVEIIHVAPFEHDSRKYFRDERKNKLYKAISSTPGPYIGRWNPRLGAIETDIPDSDAEE